MDSAMEGAVRASPAKEGPCGGTGGVDKDMNMSGVTRVVKIIVYHGEAVDSVEILYECNGKGESTGKWGGTGGTRSEVNLDRDEYLTNVKGYIGKLGNLTVVRSLTFVSNKHSYGPFGPHVWTKEDMPFQLPAVCGKILGFHGRAGGLLDAFGTYVVKGSIAP